MTLRRAGIELMEFVIGAESPAAGKELGQLGLPAGVALPLVVRGGETIRPDDATSLRAEDTVIALLPMDQEPLVREALMGAANGASSESKSRPRGHE
jgi:Trk K+ transport system NAD-binding subunit